MLGIMVQVADDSVKCVDLEKIFLRWAVMWALSPLQFTLFIHSFAC